MKNEKSLEKGKKIDTDQLENHALAMLIRIFQVFTHDFLAKIPADLDQEKYDQLVKKVSGVIKKLFENLSDQKLEIQVKPMEIVYIQDQILLDYEYLETMWGSEIYPYGVKNVNIMHAINRLCHVSFELSSKNDSTPYFDQQHYWNFIVVFIERLLWTASKKGKVKQELFRDSSFHTKVLLLFISYFHV